MTTILKLQKAGGIYLGKFFPKQAHSLYVDLRPIVSFPALLKEISEEIWAVAKNYSFDLMCGVPYGAFAIATSISITHEVPMLFRRKEAKNRGLERMVEGNFKPGMRCIVIEDVVSTGKSVLETIYDLRSAGLIVTDVITWLNREQGGRENLAAENLTLSSVYTLANLSRIVKEPLIHSDC
ncbi:MAG: phosphoribosyltransferase family protein [Waddliaceae bacterium]